MLLQHNIKRSADFMETITEKGAKIVMSVGVTPGGQMFAAHDTGISKEVLIQMLTACVEGMKNSGIHTDIKPHILRS